MSSTTSAAPAATTTGSTEKHDGKSNSNNPLLFFVALGFGVVFTNLWIIVGVKYCFRYNARNRAARILNENGDPIDLDNMPPGHRRRRKEKKLMSMQEVNERFPLTKYKVFRSSREAVGVPAGGVPTSPSRPASARRVEGVNSSMVGETIAETAPPQTALAIAQQDHAEAVTSNIPPKPIPQVPTNTDLVAEKNDTAARSSSVGTGDDDDEDDPIRTAAPAEMLDVPGDTCAICIDTLDDDDDVRGLTCGHAFHGSCVDPWLTSRRACCPLCKADYYVPKPRDAAAEGERGSVPTYPSHTWIGPGGFRPHMILTSRGFFLGDQVQERMNGPRGARRNHAARPTNTTTTDGMARPGFFGRWRPGAQSATTTTPTAETTNASTDPTITTQTPPTSTWRSMLPRLRRGEESRTQEAQLEAGTRTVR